MLDHVDFAVHDLALSRAFYTAALAPLGFKALIDVNRDDGRQGTGFGRDGLAQFFIGGGRPVEGRLHVAFSAHSRTAVDEFHRAALAAGGGDKGKPGLRPQYEPHYYAAYVIDPDGHTVEAVCRRPG
jgi:catechol 2,3-dioxygenase-like lactoylglutathione lyase family enzyme